MMSSAIKDSGILTLSHLFLLILASWTDVGACWLITTNLKATGSSSCLFNSLVIYAPVASSDSLKKHFCFSWKFEYFWHVHTKMLLPNPVFPCLQEVNCWHDLDNTEYDCWPINSPNDYNMISCGGEFFIGVFVWLPQLIFFVVVVKKIRCFLSWLRIKVKMFNTLSCCSLTAYIYGVRKMIRRCVCCGRSGNGLGAASSRESHQWGRVQCLVHCDGCRFFLWVCCQKQDLPVRVSVLHKHLVSSMSAVPKTQTDTHTHTDSWCSETQHLPHGTMKLEWKKKKPKKKIFIFLSCCNNHGLFVWHCVISHHLFVYLCVFLCRNASEARRFCHEHECPANWNSANEMNCCVYHANIHSCPLGLMVGISVFEKTLHGPFIFAFFCRP